MNRIELKASSVTDVLTLLKTEVEAHEASLLWTQMFSVLDFYKDKGIQKENFYREFIKRLVARFVGHIKNGINNDYLCPNYIEIFKQEVENTVNLYINLDEQDLKAKISHQIIDLELAVIKQECRGASSYWNNYNNFSTLLFRGHGKKKQYKLEPSVFRGQAHRESAYFREMQRNEPDYFRDLTFFEKLAKMQHYRCPTRLLDVTSNPLIALYFACSEKDEEKEGAELFVFVQPSTNLHLDSDLSVKVSSRLAMLSQDDTIKLNRYLTEVINSDKIEFKLNNDNIYENNIVEKIYQDIKSENYTQTRCLDPFMFLEPQFVSCANVSRRLKAQAGSFILPPLLSSNDQIDEMLKQMSLSIVIPEDEKENILKELDRLGINEYTVYCDLESLSKTLKNKSFI